MKFDGPVKSRETDDKVMLTARQRNTRSWTFYDVVKFLLVITVK